MQDEIDCLNSFICERERKRARVRSLFILLKEHERKGEMKKYKSPDSLRLGE